MILHILADVLRNSILITGLVITMMLLIEYINVQTQGQLSGRLRNSSFFQVVLGSLLGLIPGCMGGFATVSLYTHGVIGLGALVAMMIASSGDEAFVMLAMVPKEALILAAILLPLSIIVGLAVNFFTKGRKLQHSCPDDFRIHSNDRHHDDGHGHCDHSGDCPHPSFKALLHPSWQRIVMLLGVGAFTLCLGMGLFEHSHGAGAEGCGGEHSHGAACECCEGAHAGHGAEAACESCGGAHAGHGAEIACESCEGAHAGHGAEAVCKDAGHGAEAECTEASCGCGHSHAAEAACESGHTVKHGINLLDEYWLNLIFALVGLFVLYFLATSNEHFIKEHLWKHVICRHLLPIFCWSAGALLIIELGMHYFDIGPWLKENVAILILLAALIGIIPESGPHMVFITMFASGLVPFSVLLSSSISQDGHAGLPLLAEDKKGFLMAKAINVVVALLAGYLCYMIGY